MTTYKNRFFEFSTGFHGIRLSYSPCAYYNDRVLSFSPGWGSLYIHLGDSGKQNDVNDETNYGFYYYESSLWIQYGKKIKSIHMPWDYDWVRTSYLLKDNTWVHETKYTNRNIDTDSIIDIFEEQYMFIDKYNSTGTMATIHVEEREWRQRWLKWTSLFSKVRRTIDVSFQNPIGKGVWSWKGGTLGCDYKMQEGEEPFDTLMRMQEDRKF